MHFWWNADIKNFFFEKLDVTTLPGFVILCLCLVVTSCCFEGMKLLQTRQRQYELKLRARQLKQICPLNNESTGLLRNSNNDEVLAATKILRCKLYATDITLWFSQWNIAYFLMLTIMLYNGWTFISILLGSTLGYFIFGQRFMKLNLENCQILRETYCMKECGTIPDDHMHLKS